MLLANAITLIVMGYIKDSLCRASAGIPDVEGFWYESLIKYLMDPTNPTLRTD
jgi:hypothetical protein